jgi:predicted Zn-dependent peptidase
VHAITTPDKLEQLLAVTGTLLREQARAIDPVHLERAKNQLAFSRVRASERTFTSMERAVEEVFVHGAVTPVNETIGLIEAITAEEVRSVFERMLMNKPALAITGKGATGKEARRLAGTLVAALG